MWVYITLNNTYVVGFFAPDGEWYPESNHGEREEAARRVHYLNGGRLEDAG